MRGWWFWAVAAALFLLWPDEMDAGGLLVEIGWILGAALVATPVLVYFAILKNLPEDPPVTPVGLHEVPPEVDDIVREYEDLGFERAGPPLRVGLPNPAVLVPLLHATEGMLATAYRLDAKPSPKLGYDVIHILDAPESGLTTCMDHSAGVLPAPRGGLRQIFPRATPSELVDRHRAALRFVESRRLGRMHAAPSAVAHLIKRSFALQRRAFLDSPVAGTFTALWRVITKRNPHLGALADQAGIEERLQSIPRAPSRRRAAASV